MSGLAAHGVSIDVPSGWEAELSVQPDPASLDPSLAPSSLRLVVLHLANFSLPAQRGDYGSGAVETMDRGGIFAALVEFDPAAVTAKLFRARRAAARLDPDRFAPEQLHLSVPGQAGLQRFFREGARAFCLYAVIGAHSRRAILVARTQPAPWQPSSSTDAGGTPSSGPEMSPESQRGVVSRPSAPGLRRQAAAGSENLRRRGCVACGWP